MRSPDLGFPAFVVLLMVLLPVMLIAVIRLPEWQGSSEEDARPSCSRQRHGCAGPGHGNDGPSRGNAAGQEGARIAAGEKQPDARPPSP